MFSLCQMRLDLGTLLENINTFLLETARTFSSCTNHFSVMSKENNKNVSENQACYKFISLIEELLWSWQDFIFDFTNCTSDSLHWLSWGDGFLVNAMAFTVDSIQFPNDKQTFKVEKRQRINYKWAQYKLYKNKCMKEKDHINKKQKYQKNMFHVSDVYESGVFFSIIPYPNAFSWYLSEVNGDVCLSSLTVSERIYATAGTKWFGTQSLRFI